MTSESICPCQWPTDQCEFPDCFSAKINIASGEDAGYIGDPAIIVDSQLVQHINCLVNEVKEENK